MTRMLALEMNRVIVQDRDGDLTKCWVAHGDCADKLVSHVNDLLGTERLFIHGPTAGKDQCAWVECPHPSA